jgi:NDP-sugar pyrophosphorylase family protein
MSFFKQAMILAAGMGTRLRPLSLHLPKPLFPVLNRPLLHDLLNKLEGAGFRKIVINCFYLAPVVIKMIASYKARSEIITLLEPSLLGTGGALRNALPYISKNEPLLVINSDVVTDLDLEAIVNKHRHYGSIASLVVHKKEPWNNIAVSKGSVLGFDYSGSESMAFTGISVLETEFIKNISKDRPSSLIDAFKDVINKDIHIQALSADQIADGYIWEDIGSPKGYIHAHALLFANKNNRCLVGQSTKLPQGFVWRDWVSIGDKVTLGPDITLCRSVIWKNTRIPPRTVLKNCIFTPYGGIFVS